MPDVNQEAREVIDQNLPGKNPIEDLLVKKMAEMALFGEVEIDEVEVLKAFKKKWPPPVCYRIEEVI